MIKKYAIATCFLVQAVAIFGSEKGGMEKGDNPLKDSQEIALNRSSELRSPRRGKSVVGTANTYHSWHHESGKQDSQEHFNSLRRDIIPLCDCP